MKLFNKKLIHSAIGVALLAGSSLASAQQTIGWGEQFYFDVGDNKWDEARGDVCAPGDNCPVPDDYTYPDDNTTTGLMSALGFTGFLATSVYDVDAQDNLTGYFYDSNTLSVLSNLCNPTDGTDCVSDGSPGFVNPSDDNVTGASRDGTETVVIAEPVTPGQIDLQLNGLTPYESEATGDSEGKSDNGGWSLYAEYNLFGNFLSGTPEYTSGEYKIYFEDNMGATAYDRHVITLTLDYSEVVVTGETGAVTIYWDVTFAEAGFLWVYDPITGTYVDAATSDVEARLNTTVDPATPSDSELLNLTDNNGGNYFTGDVAARQALLSGEDRFQPVPAPATILLFGLGLLGLGVRRRARSSK